ncbi:MAG TPA: hypothetical protein VK605_09420 [Solirubrobacteraceae bacterium]|nr:hypothetical protein [Solirubrobacteraceae bacterium]
MLHSGNRLEITAGNTLLGASLPGVRARMTQAVVAGAIVVAALNGMAGLLGALLWYDGDPSERGAGAFWVLLRAGQGSALVLALAVGSLAAAGNYSTDQLFYLYALLPLAIGVVAEQLRIASAQTILDQRQLPDAQAVGGLPEKEQRAIVKEIVRREVGVMALSALVVVFLALRAAGTAHGF